MKLRKTVSIFTRQKLITKNFSEKQHIKTYTMRNMLNIVILSHMVLRMYIFPSLSMMKEIPCRVYTICRKCTFDYYLNPSKRKGDYQYHN